MGQQTAHPGVVILIGCDNGVDTVGSGCIQGRILDEDLLSLLAVTVDVLPGGCGTVNESIRRNADDVSVLVVETLHGGMLFTLDIPDEMNQRSDGSQLGSRVTTQRVEAESVDDPAHIVNGQL